MKRMLHQGDIARIEGIKIPVLVVSKDYFNKSGEIIACPIFSENKSGPLHIAIKAEDTQGYVQCEKVSLFDLQIRGYSKIDRIEMAEIIDITDAIQGIFDYV